MIAANQPLVPLISFYEIQNPRENLFLDQTRHLDLVSKNKQPGPNGAVVSSIGITIPDPTHTVINYEREQFTLPPIISMRHLTISVVVGAGPKGNGSLTRYNRLGAVSHVQRLRSRVVERGGRAHGCCVSQRERGRYPRRERHLRLPDRACLQLVQPFANPDNTTNC